MATTLNTIKKTASSAAKTTASAEAAQKKPAAAKVAAPKKAVAAVAKMPAAPKKTVAPTKTAAKRVTGSKSTVTPEQRFCMVAEAAYFHAELHGFRGNPVQDWIAAEAQIAALLSKR